MKKTLAKILGILISIMLLMQSGNVLALSEKEQLENQQSEINDELEDAKKKQEEIEAQKSETMKQVESLIGKISQTETEIDALESKARDLQAQIKSKERDIEQKEIEYNEQMDLLDARIIAMYESGDTSYLEVLLTSSSITDFLSKYYYASELVDYDKQLIEETKQQKIDIENQKQQLEADKQELDTSLAQAEQKRIELNSLKSDKEEEAEKLTAEEKELQKEIEELEAANRQISNAIREAEIKYQQQLEDLKNNGDTSLGSGYFIRPVSSGYISANGYYPSSGKFHGAIDYAVSTGTVVKAAADGVVMTTANLSTSYGTYVVIRHANGLQSYYAHGTRGSIVVKPGQTVKQGEKIMLSGNTGNSQGPHLHFEVRKSPYNYSYGAKAYGDDSRVDPNNYM